MDETIVDERVQFLRALADIHHESKMVYDAVDRKKVKDWRLLEQEFRKFVLERLDLIEDPATPKDKLHQLDLENAGNKILHEYRILLREPELDWQQVHNRTRKLEGDIANDIQDGRALTMTELQISDVLSKVIDAWHERSLRLFQSQVKRLERIMEVNSLPALENF